MVRIAKLLIADSETNADLLWATGFFVPDPIIFFQHKGKKYLVASDLEYSRARKEASVDFVLPLSRFRTPGVKQSEADLLDCIFKKYRIRRVEVPAYLGVRTVDGLRRKGYPVEIKSDPFFEERMIKTPGEKKKIVACLRATEEAIEKARQILVQSRIRNGGIYWKGRRVTSEMLKKVINESLFQRGFLARRTIVAGGRQAADPHCEGSGPLKPHESIVMDVFPRSTETGYHGDITRTFLKGKAPPALRAMYEAVRLSQEIAFPLIRHNAKADQVHKRVSQLLKQRGFVTAVRNGRPEGFIHSTGHGLGLEIHEPPRISHLPERLKAGNVVTVEPGLYYPDRGGVRIEDVVFVTRNGCEILTRIPKRFEIP